MCNICGIENKEKPLNLFTDEEIENFILAVYYGVVSVKNLDPGVFLKVARKLSSGVFEGFGKTLFEVHYGTEDWLMLRALQENVYVFSAAKQYQQIRQTSALLYSGTKINSFGEFKKAAKDIFEEFNENYLRTEYNSAIAQANTASEWQRIVAQQEQFPMLTYHTVGDDRVRPTHAALDHISRPVNDNFWDSYMPPNGWNCRCTVIQDDEAKKTSLKGFVKPDDVPDIFMFNAGKAKIIFSPKHPYFDIAPRDKAWAKENFGMPKNGF